MPENQYNQIEGRDPGGINRRSETARRGSDAARFVRDLANRRTEPVLPSNVPTSRMWEVSLKWGAEGTGDGQFECPSGITVASDGSVYVADWLNNRIQKFTSEGVFVGKWESRGLVADYFDGQPSIAVASDGSVYITEASNDGGNPIRKHSVKKFTCEGVFVSEWGTQGSGDGEFNYPSGVAVAPDGSVYVTEHSCERQNRIQKFTSEGVFVSEWGTGGLGDGTVFRPKCVAVAPDGNVYVTNWGFNLVQEFTSEGMFVSEWDTSDGEFDYQLWDSGTTGRDQVWEEHETLSVAVAPDGCVYVADAIVGSIQKFSPRP